MDSERTENLPPRSAAAEVLPSASNNAPDGTLDIFDESVGVFARLEPLSLGEWLVRKRRGGLMAWESREVHADRDAALADALVYLETLPMSGTPEFDALTREAMSMNKVTE